METSKVATVDDK